MKRTTTLLAVLTLLMQMQVSAQDPNFHIYLCFGQSNMEGQGTIESADLTVDSRFQVMQALDCSNRGRVKGTWYEAIPPLCQCYSGLTPADYFGRTLVANLPDSIRVGVIVVAVGGCDIRLFDKDIYEGYDSTYPESWFLDKVAAYGGNPYAHLMDLALQAQQDGVIKGILLHQGETNTGDPQWPAYVEKIYNDMIADLSLVPDSIPMLAGQVVHADQDGVCASMNDIIDQLPLTLPNSYVIPSSGCTAQSDNLHFDSKGYRRLGFRYAQQLLALKGIEVEEPSTPPSCVITQPHNNALFQVGRDIPIRVYASDMGGTEMDGIVSRVEFYADDVKIGEADSQEDNTFSMVWTGADKGNYRITARAIDDKDTASTSAGVLITVDTSAFLAPGMSAGKGKYLGNIVGNNVRSDFNDYWNAVTAENSCKWGSVEGIRDQMNWTVADRAYAHAVEHHLVFRYHVLAWGSQYPSWIESLEPAEFKAEMEEYIAAVAERYPLTDQVEVLNENMYLNTWNNEEHAPGTPFFREGLGGPGETGYDWAIWLFKKAREYFPNTKLIINDFELETNADGRNEILDLVTVLRDSGLIDGFGTQAHYFNVDNTSSSGIRYALNEMSRSGLPLYVTELDLKGSSVTESTQRTSYVRAFPTYWDHPAVAGITLWGYVEGSTWATGTGILNADGSERLAMDWLKSYVEGRPDVGYPYDGVPPAKDPEENMLVNGEFEYGTFAWEPENLEGAQATMEVVDDALMSGAEALRICPVSPGTESSHVQVTQTVALEAGKHYMLSFLAQAGSPRKLSVVMENYTRYLEESMDLGTEKQAFSFIFEPTVSDPYNQLKFLAGSEAACISIDSVVCREVDVTGIPAAKESTDIHLYPNPNSDGLLYLEHASAGDILEIYDLSGQLMKNLEISSAGKTIDVSGLAKGMYFVSISGKGTRRSAKLVIQ